VFNDVEHNPWNVESYPGLFMETGDVSYPVPANAMVPHSGKGGWGFLTAGTLAVDKGSKSWGLLGQGDGNTNALS